jgi:hypothetical protein
MRSGLSPQPRGPSLLQGSINEGGKLPSSFGASRIYLPAQTLADLYGWEEVQSYIEEITAPEIASGRVVDVQAGAGADIDRRMPLLSTYLGHIDPASTYWYLEAVPELLELISRRLEQLPGALP